MDLKMSLPCSPNLWSPKDSHLSCVTVDWSWKAVDSCLAFKCTASPESISASPCSRSGSWRQVGIFGLIRGGLLEPGLTLNESAHMELYETFYAIAQWKAPSLIPHPKAEGENKSGPMRCDGLKYVCKLFNVISTKRWSLISLPLSESCT